MSILAKNLFFLYLIIFKLLLRGKLSRIKSTLLFLEPLQTCQCGRGRQPVFYSWPLGQSYLDSKLATLNEKNVECIGRWGLLSTAG